MKISIVMAYYNRKSLVVSTLNSISNTKYNDYEVIIVDDASKDEERLEDCVSSFNMDIKLIRVAKESKKHINPCVPFNLGFKESKGDIVIIQNPECYHRGDILSHASNLKENQYNIYHCYSLTEEKTSKLLDSNNPSEIVLHDRRASFNGDDAYYVHGRIFARPYHFCSAIHRKDLEDLNGFDERYANGRGYDDDEFATRVRRKGLQMVYVEDPLVLHQWHYDHPAANNATNANLFRGVTLKESGWKVNNER